MIPVRDDLRALEGYHSPQVDVRVRLNTNESPLPPPAAWRDAFAAELSRAADTYPSVAARQDAVRCESGRLAELARAVERLGQALGVADAARDHAAREVGERGFSDLDRARLACRDSSETRQLEDRVSAWNELLAALKAAALPRPKRASA